MLKDADIRTALHKTEIARQIAEVPSTRVIDELGILEGAKRIDVAVINGLLHGYEIKSAADTLARLPAQQANYNQVFDKITLVADAFHIEEALRVVPQSWGLIVADNVGGEAVLNEIWPARQNFLVEPFSLAQLLWREEAWAICREFKIGRGMHNKPRKMLWQVLATELPLQQLRTVVRRTLKQRQGWRE